MSQASTTSYTSSPSQFVVHGSERWMQSVRTDPHTAARRALLIGFCSILAHAFNVQIMNRMIYHTHHKSFTSTIMTYFLFQVGSIVFFPFVLWTKFSRSCLQEELKSLNATPKQFMLMVMIVDIVKCLSYLLYAWSSQLANKETLNAVFESSIGMVYFLSLKFLDEDLSLFKVAGVMLALMGVCLIQIVKEKKIASSVITQAEFDDADARFSGVENTLQAVIGSFIAILAEMLRISYHIWWKCRFGFPSLRFVLLWYALVGMVHLCVIGPFIVFCEVVLVPLGCSHKMFGLFITLGETDVMREAILIAVVCMFASLGGIGSLCVVAQHSPLLWSAVRLLTFPVGIGLEFFIEFKVPASFMGIGCALIVGSFLAVSGLHGVFARSPACRQSLQSLQVAHTRSSDASEPMVSKRSAACDTECEEKAAKRRAKSLKRVTIQEDSIEMMAMSSAASTVSSDIISV